MNVAVLLRLYISLVTCNIAGRERRTIKEISSDQQLQAQLRWDVHVRDVFAICMFLVVVQVLANFLKYNATSHCQLRV